MTYAALQSQTLASTNSLTSKYYDGLSPVGTDEAESARYNEMYGIGTVNDDIADEFRDAFGVTS